MFDFKNLASAATGAIIAAIATLGIFGLGGKDTEKVAVPASNVFSVAEWCEFANTEALPPRIVLATDPTGKEITGTAFVVENAATGDQVSVNLRLDGSLAQNGLHTLKDGSDESVPISPSAAKCIVEKTNKVTR